MKILFLDLCCPKPYSPTTLLNEPMGGTEATVVRVAEALGETHEVYVAQKGREEPENRKAVYGPLVEDGNYDRVVTLRDVRGIPFIKRTWPRAACILWCHDEIYSLLAQHAELLKDVLVLGVSNYHKHRITEALLGKNVKVDYVYNPVVTQTPSIVDRGKGVSLLYFSSPHKGLRATLDVFRKVRSEIPEFHLLVANPGYYQLDDIKQEGVEVLGELPHSEVLKQVAQSFAILHCNAEFPETFGLVHAEANTLGVPVITSTLGASREILTNFREQCVNIKNPDAVIGQLKKWQKNYPVIVGKPEFKLENVMRKWNEILR